MKQKQLIEALERGDRLVNNALVGPAGDTREDRISDRQIEAVGKKVNLTESVDGSLTTRRLEST